MLHLPQALSRAEGHECKLQAQHHRPTRRKPRHHPYFPERRGAARGLFQRTRPPDRPPFSAIDIDPGKTRQQRQLAHQLQPVALQLRFTLVAQRPKIARLQRNDPHFGRRYTL